MPDRVHVVVVGGGLFGAATARHLTEAGHGVTVVASPEPKGSCYLAGGGPMASHYDQGRIVRMGGGDALSASLATSSVRRYPGLARRSGIPFFNSRPVVLLCPDPESELQCSQAQGADVRAVGLDELAATTDITAPAGFRGGAVIEASTAGVVNPRLLVQAQLQLAQTAGATVVADEAVRVQLNTDQVRVETAGGYRVAADHVVVATGAYGAELLETAPPTIQRRLRTIALIEVEGNTDDLPSLSGAGFLHPAHDPKLEEVYWVPPVRYPDGGLYLKIGGNSLPMITASDNDDIGPWFESGGSAQEAAALFALAQELLPERRLRLAAYKPCVVSYTDNEKPIIERVDGRVTLALAGNGAGATIGDEVGRRAAFLAAGPS